MLLFAFVGEMVRVAAEVLRCSDRDSLLAFSGEVVVTSELGEAVTTVPPGGGHSPLPPPPEEDERRLRFSGQSRCFEWEPVSRPRLRTCVVMSSAPPPSLVLVVPVAEAEPDSPVHLVKVTSDSLLSSGATLPPPPPPALPAGGDEYDDGDCAGVVCVGASPEFMMLSSCLLTMSLT